MWKGWKCIYSTNTTLTKWYERWSFSVKLIFACTINKSQGQSLKSIETSFDTPCFCHSQLYLCSKSGDVGNLCLYALNKKKNKNVVY